MKIGIDFDNTLVNTIEVTNKYLNGYMPNHNLNSYHELSLEEETKFLDKYYNVILNEVKLFKGVNSAIKELKNMGCELYLITARGGDKWEDGSKTMQRLSALGITFDHYLWGSFIKGKICKENKIDLMIDDLDTVCKDVKSKGVKVLKFGASSDEFNYAENWIDVIKFIKKGL